MAKKFLVSIDLNQNELQNARIQNLATAPSSPVEGQLYFDSSAGDKSMYFWDGTSWIDMGGDLRSVSAGTGISVTGTRDVTVSLDTASTRNTDHSSITLTAGAGLTGGGDITASRTFDVGAGTGITVNANDVALDVASTLNTDHSGVTLTAGAGLTGGGDITTSRTFNVGAGTGISVAADSVGLDTGSTLNTDHASVSIIAGAGLTGGGTIAANRTIDIGAGEGITVNADSIQLKNSAALTNNVLSKWDDTNGQFVNSTITDDGTTVTIAANLTVTGVTTTVNSNTVNIGDSIITLNSDETGAPSQDGGFEIERGTSTNVSLLWDETNDRWTVGAYNFVAATFIGDLSGNATTATSAGTAATADKWTNARTITLGGDLTGSVSIDGSANVTLTATVAANSVALGTDTTGDYVAGATGSNGVSVSGSGGEGSTLSITGTAASTTAVGVVELATLTETRALTDTTRAVTAASLAGLRHAETGPSVTGLVHQVTHNLGTTDVIVQVYEVAGGATVECDVIRNSTSQVTISFAQNVLQDTLRILVIKVA